MNTCLGKKYWIYGLLSYMMVLLVVGCEKEKENDIIPDGPDSPAKNQISILFYAPSQTEEKHEIEIRYIIKSNDVRVVNYGYMSDDSSPEYFILQIKDTIYLVSSDEDRLSLCQYNASTGTPDSLIYSVERKADNSYIRSCHSYDWEKGVGVFTQLDHGALPGKSTLRDAGDEEIKRIIEKHLDRFEDQIDLLTTAIPAQGADAVDVIWGLALKIVKSFIGIEIDPVEETEAGFVDSGIEYTASVYGYSDAYAMVRAAVLAFGLVEENTPQDKQEGVITDYNGNISPLLRTFSEIPAMPAKREDIYFLVQPQSLVFHPKGGSRGVSVVSSYNWDIESKPEWCEITKGQETFFIDVEASPMERKGTIVVYSDMRIFDLGIARVEIAVRQGAGLGNTKWNTSFQYVVEGENLSSRGLLEFGDISKGEIYFDGTLLPEFVDEGMTMTVDSYSGDKLVLVYKVLDEGVDSTTTYTFVRESNDKLSGTIYSKAIIQLENMSTITKSYSGTITGFLVK
ncbi:BACON domain-containing protein [Parabacteroides sp.]